MWATSSGMSQEASPSPAGGFQAGGFGGKGGDIAQGATVDAVEVAKEAGDGVDHETPAVASKMVVCRMRARSRPSGPPHEAIELDDGTPLALVEGDAAPARDDLAAGRGGGEELDLAAGVDGAGDREVVAHERLRARHQPGGVEAGRRAGEAGIVGAVAELHVGAQGLGRGVDGHGPPVGADKGGVDA